MPRTHRTLEGALEARIMDLAAAIRKNATAITEGTYLGPRLEYGRMVYRDAEKLYGYLRQLDEQ